jgi:WD40 repeat protein
MATECRATFTIWDREHPEQRRILGYGTGVGQGLAFSPNGQLLAAATTNGITLWDTATWQPRRTLPAQDAVLAFSGDGTILAAFGSDGLQAWSTAGWQPRLAPGELKMPGRGHRTVALNRHGTLLAASVAAPGLDNATQRDDLFTLWNLPQRQLLIRETTNVVSPQSLAFSPDDRWLAVGAWPGTVHLWKLQDDFAATRFHAHQGLATGVAFAPGGQALISAGADQLIRIWKLGGGEPLARLRGHLEEITCLRVSADGQWILSASRDRTTRLWHASGKPHHSTPAWPIPEQRLLHTFSPDARRLFTTCPVDWNFEEWDGRTGDLVRRVPMQQTNLLWGLAGLTRPDDLPKTIQRSYFLVDWDAFMGRVKEKTDPGRICALSAGGPPWASVATTVDGVVFAWDRENGALVYSNKMGAAPVFTGKQTREQRLIVGAEKLAGGFRFRPFVWDLTNSRVHAVCPLWVGGSPLATAGAEDLSQFVYPGEAGIVVWDVTRGWVRFTLKVPPVPPLEAVALSPDNEWLAVATGSSAPQIWSLRTGRLASPPLQGHLAGVFKLRFSADGRTLITYSMDMTARLWNVATGREVMSGLPINLILRWHPLIQILSKDESAAIEPEGEDRWRVIPLPTLAEIDEAERQRAAAERVAGAQLIQQWLVLAPIPFAAGQPGTAALDREQLPNESQLRPRAGLRVRVGGRALVWRRVELRNGLLDLEALGSGHEYAVAYAVCYLRADAPKRGLVMRVGSDDQAVIYLNGRQIFRSVAVREFAFDADRVGNVELEAGLNVLVFKLVNEAADWGGAIRLTDAAGAPVSGVRITLEP